MELGLAPDPDILRNAFERPLNELEPDLASLPGIMRNAGAPTVAISGAGPAHYSIMHDCDQAESVARKLQSQLAGKALVTCVAPVPPRTA
jgi:4-diphosphocytidyl-2C-methyl-D-erythritol kinase